MGTNEDVIRARIDPDLKRAFEDVCKANDRTASQVLRDFIRAYVKANGQGDLLKGAIR